MCNIKTQKMQQKLVYIVHYYKSLKKRDTTLNV